MSNDNEIEIKCVFNLLDPNNTQQIHIQHVNNIVQSIESISPERKRSKTTTTTTITTTTAGSENDIVRNIKITPRRRDTPERKRHTILIKPTTNPYSHRSSIKKGSHDVYMEAMEKIRRGGTIVTEQTDANESLDVTVDIPEVPERGEISPGLKAFPNNKKTMNMGEFSELYEEVFESNSIEEEVLLKCFTMFDYEQKGYLNAQMLQKVFEVFNEKVTEADAENLMKFIGCSGNKMTFNEFKDFFRKNL